MASRGLWHFMGARTRRSLALSWSALFVLSLLLQYVSFATAPAALAVHGIPPGLFELDGNAINDAAVTGDDWNSHPGATGNRFTFIDDLYNSASDVGFSGGGSKDDLNTSSWEWTKSTVTPDKDDIEHAYAASYESGGDTFVYFGLDKLSVNGDSNVGFWFFKNGIGLTGSGASGGFAPVHSVGDLLVLSQFTNGGQVSTIDLYEWVGSGGNTNGTLQLLATGNACTGSPAVDKACAVANTAATPSPWPYHPKAGADDIFPTASFFEGGINLDELFGGDAPCFSGFLANTRTSQSVDAVLKDVAVGQFNTCVPPTITTDASVSTFHFGNAAVTDTATLSGTDGPASGKVKFFVCDPTEITGAGCPAGTGSQVGAAAGVTVTTSANGGTATSAGFTPTAAGKYCFRAEYTPDAASQYLAATHTNATTECFTVVKNDTSIATAAEQTVSVGTAISDSATLSGATADAGGNIVFRAYGPGDGDCTNTATFVSAAFPVSGNGTYGPASFIPSTAGTYRWIASYSGDAHNQSSIGACNDAGENDTVQKVNPTIATQASADVIVGGQIHDTATVSGGQTPTGTVTFKLYGPNDATCANAAIFTSGPIALSGASATSGNFTTSQVGTYRWRATYNGDVNNNAVTGACNAANENVVVSPASPSITTSLSGDGKTGASITVPLGTAVHDTSTLTGATATAGGTVHYQVFTDPQCEVLLQDAGTKTVTNHIVPNSNDITFIHAGVYYWQADYSGDANNDPASSACNLETVTVDQNIPAIVTNASGTVQVGGNISDSATLSGGFSPVGWITFQLFGPDDATCSGAVAFANTVTVSGNGVYPSGNFTTTAAGTYRWVASYSGDGDNAAVSGGCNAANENVVVTPRNPTVVTTASASVQVNNPISDSATLAGGFNPTGSITFNLYGPADATCTGAVKYTNTVTVNGNGVYGSGDYTAVAAGTYHWIANYSGDANNNATANGCNAANENVIVTKKSPAISTLATDGAQVGDQIHDVATVTGGFNATGTVTFRLYAPADANCDAAAIFTDTASLNAQGVATSGNYTVTEKGLFHWVASYGGDANNDPATGACGDAGESTDVNVFNPAITTTLHSGQISGAKITVLFGSSVFDQAVLTGASATAGGTVTYTVYNDSACTDVFADAGAKTVTNGVVPASDPVSFPTAGTYYWQASYSGDAANAQSTSPCADEVLTVTTPNLHAVKLVKTNDGSFGPTSTAVPGDTLTFQITVTNSGDADATNVPVSDDIADVLAHATYNADCNLGCNLVGSTLNWTIPTIAKSGGSVVLTFSVTLDATFPAGTTHLPNVVVVTGPGSNCAAQSEDADCDTDTTVQAQPDLNVTKLVATGDSAFGPTSVANPGDVLHYQITISNVGNADATNVPVSDNIAALLAHAAYNADCSNGCNFAASTLTWTIPTIAAGGHVTLTFSVTLNNTFPTGTTELPNVVVVLGPGSNCAAGSTNEDCDTDTTVATSLLTIEKGLTGNTGGTDPDLGVPAAKIGDTLHYTLTYHGEGPLTNAVITDVLPAGLEYVAGSAAGGTHFTFISYTPATRTLLWKSAALLVLDPATKLLPKSVDGTVTYNVKVLTIAPDLAQPLVNTATIDSDQTAPDSDTASVAVLAPPLDLTPPPTSTITPQTGTSNPGFALMLILLGVAGLTLGIGFITPTPARVRRRDRLG